MRTRGGNIARVVGGNNNFDTRELRNERKRTTVILEIYVARNVDGILNGKRRPREAILFSFARENK